MSGRSAYGRKQSPSLTELTDFGRKESLVVQLILHPSHEVVDVFGGGALDGFLDCLTICPVILILGPCRHDRAGLFQTELCDGAVQHVDLVEKVHSWERLK